MVKFVSKSIHLLSISIIKLCHIFLNLNIKHYSDQHHQMANIEIRLIAFFAAKDGDLLYTVSKNKTGSWLWLRSWTPYCQIQTILEKVGKTTRPFRYDLNQIPYVYTVEATNRFKGLDLIECLENYGWRFMTLYRRQWSRPSSRKRNIKRQNVCLRRPYNTWEMNTSER